MTRQHGRVDPVYRRRLPDRALDLPRKRIAHGAAPERAQPEHRGDARSGREDEEERRSGFIAGEAAPTVVQRL